MTSCEPARSNAYSDNLHWRIAWQMLALRLPIKQVATNLCINQSTVRRIHDKFGASGQLQKRTTYPAEKANRKLTEPAQFFILYLVLKWPWIYLREMSCSPS